MLQEYHVGTSYNAGNINRVSIVYDEKTLEVFDIKWHVEGIDECPMIRSFNLLEKKSLMEDSLKDSTEIMTASNVDRKLTVETKSLYMSRDVNGDLDASNVMSFLRGGK